jgi:hypothetical protein
VLTGADVSLTGMTVVLVAVTAAVVVVVDDDELVHPVTRTIPKTKIAIASAIARFRFLPEIFFKDREIKLICMHLRLKIIHIYLYSL